MWAKETLSSDDGKIIISLHPHTVRLLSHQSVKRVSRAWTSYAQGRQVLPQGVFHEMKSVYATGTNYTPDYIKIGKIILQIIHLRLYLITIRTLQPIGAVSGAIMLTEIM